MYSHIKTPIGTSTLIATARLTAQTHLLTISPLLGPRPHGLHFHENQLDSSAPRRGLAGSRWRSGAPQRRDGPVFRPGRGRFAGVDFTAVGGFSRGEPANPLF